MKEAKYYSSFIKSDPDGNRTRVTAVKGRCLNRLTMEPCLVFFPAALSRLNSPSRARTYNPAVNSRVLYHLIRLQP